MSTTLTGDATASDLYLSRTVTGATNASPIVITTSASHLFATGDRVVVASVGGNTAANGEFYITKVSATTFSLDGSTGNGAYTSGGTAACITMTPQFTIPADGDTLDAASVNAALEALADRTQTLALAVKNRVDDFTASGTWTAPDNCYAVLLEGCGGGGGGAGGCGSNTTTDRYVQGGGGGGAAPLVKRVVAVTPGTTYAVTIGGGGAGGAGGASGNNNSVAGTDGTDTTFDSLATFVGGQGAPLVNYLQAVTVASGNTGFASPGVAKSLDVITGCVLVRGTPASGPHGAGGYGIDGATNGAAYSGSPSVTGYAGGGGGLTGGDSATYRAGGGGGGGGGGPYGAGATGGNGGGGNNAGAGVAGTAAAAAAAANTGGGGGGGGAAGHGTSGAAGGAGAAGGSGRLKVFYVGPKATVT